MYDLTVRMHMQPAEVAVIADWAAAHAAALTTRDAHGRLMPKPHKGRPNLNLLVVFNDDGKPEAFVSDIQEPGRWYPPKYDGGDQPHLTSAQVTALRRPMLTIPVTAMLHDVVLRTEDLAAHNAQKDPGDD